MFLSLVCCLLFNVPTDYERFISDAKIAITNDALKDFNHQYAGKKVSWTGIVTNYRTDVMGTEIHIVPVKNTTESYKTIFYFTEKIPIQKGMKVILTGEIGYITNWGILLHGLNIIHNN